MTTLTTSPEPEARIGGQAPALTDHTITVLLVDDQAMIGEAVRRMLADEQDIRFHYCADPAKALPTAAEIGATIILQDLVMPDVDGMTLLRFYRANPGTRDVPVIVLSTKEDPKVKAEAFALGASDYIVKLPDRIELLARIRHHSRGYINLLQRNEAFQALVASRKALDDDLNEAAEYVRALLPEPVAGDITTTWRYIPCSSLGGDSFGHSWLDDEHLAIYLLDVCGHGVGAALLSISAMNILRSQALPKVDFSQPSEVLIALNNAFPMEQQGGKYFTLWYGVFNKTTRKLVYASGGHPPSVLVAPGDPPQSLVLPAKGMVIGGMAGIRYKSFEADVAPGSRLYVYSDGVYEVTLPDGTIWDFKDFVSQLVAPSTPELSVADRVLAKAREIGHCESFDDDYSFLEVILP